MASNKIAESEKQMIAQQLREAQGKASKVEEQLDSLNRETRALIQSNGELSAREEALRNALSQIRVPDQDSQENNNPHNRGSSLLMASSTCKGAEQQDLNNSLKHNLKRLRASASVATKVEGKTPRDDCCRKTPTM